MDLAGIHATEGGNVEREGGRAGGVVGAGANDAGAGGVAAAIDIDLVGAGGDVEGVGPDAGIDGNSAAEDVSVVGLPAIQAVAGDANGATTYPVALQAAVAEDGGAGGEGGMGGINEAAAVAADAGGVGDDELGPAAGDFDIAIEQAGVAAVDFVEDDAGGAAGQVGIALYPASQLGLHITAAVVEDGALVADIKLAVYIAGNTGGAGGLDVDQGHTAGALQDSGLLVTGGMWVGHDASSLGGGDHDQAEEAPETERQWFEGDGDCRASPRALATRAPCTATTGDRLGHRQQQAACTVENQAVAVFVHW